MLVRSFPPPSPSLTLPASSAGASEGEGLGNQFLANIREADAICQVTRAFSDPDVTHVDGKVDPASDIETITTELLLGADMQTLEKQIPRLDKEVKGKKTPKEYLDTAQEALKFLEEGKTINSVMDRFDPEIIKSFQLMTAKLFIYVFNTDDEGLADEKMQKDLSDLVAPAEAIFLDAKFESELVELSEEEAAEMLEETGQEEAGLDKLARVGFETLGLQTYLTAGEKETRAWTIKKGWTAPQAAGVHPRHPLRNEASSRPKSCPTTISSSSDPCRKPRLQVGNPHGGQGIRYARRRRGGIPLQ